jgi:hypothetical protein
MNEQVAARQNAAGSFASSLTRDSTGCEESRAGSSRANPQADPLGTFRAIAFVGGCLAIDVNSSVNVAANEVDADETPPRGCRVARRPAARHIVGQIKMFACHACAN